MSIWIEKTFNGYIAFAKESQKRTVGFHTKFSRIIDAWHNTTQSRFGRSWTAFVACSNDRRTYTILYICKFAATGCQRTIRSNAWIGTFARGNGNNYNCHEKSKHIATSIGGIDTRNKNVCIISVSRIAGWISWLFKFVRFAQKFSLFN